MMKTTVIHHSADFDGIFCREIARKFLPDAELIGWDYGDKPIAFPAEGKVYVLDLSPDCFSGDVLCQNLVWIDHHKSAIEKWSAAIPGYRIDGVAACRLAWQWFSFTDAARAHPLEVLPVKQRFIDRNVQEPIAIRLAGEYDIWDKRDPNAELFQHGLRGTPLTDGIWDELLEPRLLPNLVDSMLENGRAVQYAKDLENEDIITSYGFTVKFDGLTFLACNHARFNSHLFAAGIKPEHDALLGFKWDGKQWGVSLYHAPGKERHDLSMIAVKHGGGGHRGACGFRSRTLPFLPLNAPE